MTPRNRFASVPVVAAIVLGVAAASASVVRAADDTPWSNWIALPDRYNGAVDVRYRTASGKDAASSEIEFRNRYDQKVRVTFRLSGRDAKGDAQQIDKTFSLNAKEVADKKGEKVEIVHLENAAVEKIEFDGQPPKPTSAGYSFAAANLENWRTALHEVRNALKSAEEDEKDADRTLSQVRAGAASTGARASNDQVGQAGGATGSATVTDVQQADREAKFYSERAGILRKAAQNLEGHVKEAEAAAAAPPPSDTEAARANTSVAMTSSPAVPTVASGKPAAPPADLSKLNELIKTANEAAKAGDWPKAEETLRNLRAQENYSKIRENERANIEFFYGNALGRDNKLPEAETAYREAIKLDPKNAAFHDGLAIALANQGKLGEALAAFQTAVNLEPGNATYQVHLKTIQEATKKK